MAVSQIEATLKPYNTYIPPINSRRTQDRPLNSLDEVQNWVQLHRPNVTNDRACANLEFLCTLNTPSPKRLKYLLELCKKKKPCHFRNTLLETQEILCIPLSFITGRRRAIWRTEEAGGYELSRRNLLRCASNAGKYGQPTSWPRRAALTAKRTLTGERSGPKKRG